MMMQCPTNEPKPCVGGQISRGLLNDELPHGATEWVMS
jgi:hypothetical protein